MTDGDDIRPYVPGGVNMRPLQHFGKWTDENDTEAFIGTNPVASARARAMWERMWNQFNQGNEGGQE